MLLKGLLFNGVLFLMIAGPVFSAVNSEVFDPHFGRNLELDSKDGKTAASIGGEFAAFVVFDEVKKAGGGEFRLFPYVRFLGDITRQISANDLIGLGFEVIEPGSALVDIEDDRKNRITARNYFYSPQWPVVKGYWVHKTEDSLMELDVGRDRFLGYDSLFGNYQGSLPVVIRSTQYWDNGISLRYEKYSSLEVLEQMLYGFRVSVLDSEGWVGMSDSWFANSYFRFGAQGEIHVFSVLGFPRNLGDMVLLASWTNAEGGSSAGGNSVGAKESFEHFVYGAQYSFCPFGLDFTTRFLFGEMTRGKNDIDNHEETAAWAWESLLSGITLGKSKLDLYASISDSQYDGGEKYWIWKGEGTFQKQYMAGAKIREAFGIEHLSVIGAYFQNDLDGEKSLRTLFGEHGFWFGLVYDF